MADMDHSGSGFNRGSTLEYPAPYIDRWKSARDYDKLAEEYVNDESEPDDGKQKKKDWWSTDIKVEFDQLKTGNPDMISTRSCAASYFFEKSLEEIRNNSATIVK